MTYCKPSKRVASLKNDFYPISLKCHLYVLKYILKFIKTTKRFALEDVHMHFTRHSGACPSLLKTMSYCRASCTTESRGGIPEISLHFLPELDEFETGYITACSFRRN